MRTRPTLIGAAVAVVATAAFATAAAAVIAAQVHRSCDSLPPAPPSVVAAVPRYLMPGRL